MKAEISSQTFLPLWDGGRSKERPQDGKQGDGRGWSGADQERAQREAAAGARARSPGGTSLFSPLGWGGLSRAAVRGAGAGATCPALRAGPLHCSCAGRASVRVSVCAPVCARASPGRRAPVRSALLSPHPLPFHRRPSPCPQRAHLPVPAVLIENLPGNLGGGRGRGKEPRNGRRGERRGRLLTAWSLQHLLRHTSSLPGHRVGQSPGDLHPLGCPSCPLCTGRIMTLALRLRFCSPPPRYYVSGW